MIFTLLAKLSDAVYCNRSCLRVCLCVFVGLLPQQLETACIDPHQTGFVGKGSDHLQLIKFWPLRPWKGGLQRGETWDPLITFEWRRAIRFKFDTDIEDGASLHREHNDPQVGVAGSRDLIS